MFPVQSWQILQQAEGVVPSMRNICSSVANEWGRWKDWRSDTSAHRAPLPGAWEGKLNRFQKMIVVRALSQVTNCNRRIHKEQNERRVSWLATIMSTLKDTFVFPPANGFKDGPVFYFFLVCFCFNASKANVHGAVADFVEHYFGRDLVQFSSSGAVVAVEEVIRIVLLSPISYLLSLLHVDERVLLLSPVSCRVFQGRLVSY